MRLSAPSESAGEGVGLPRGRGTRDVQELGGPELVGRQVLLMPVAAGGRYDEHAGAGHAQDGLSPLDFEANGEVLELR